jgi:hypothetical protein
MKCHNRLTVVGPAPDVRKFVRQEDWPPKVIRYVILLEQSPRRHIWQCQSPGPPLAWCQTLSSRWPTLTLLLDYDDQARQHKGLVKARQGRVQHFHVAYQFR